MAEDVKWTSKELDVLWNEVARGSTSIRAIPGINLTSFRRCGLNVEEIVGNWLRNHGYDGLYADDICWCFLDELVRCDGVVFPTCRPGYRQPDPDHPGDWMIGPKKQEG